MALCLSGGLLEGLPEWLQRVDGFDHPPRCEWSVTSVSSTSQLSDMVKWQLTNKTAQPQLVTCEVLVLTGSTQLGELGPMHLAVAAGATAEQFSEVTTLAGSGASDTAQVLCQKG